MQQPTSIVLLQGEPRGKRISCYFGVNKLNQNQH
uniref:Uncharacterized protein n=1 Tax=Zea mays TaxID=4577 RepID=C4IZ48_MAIZE|nr:unknown [Zea mays]